MQSSICTQNIPEFLQENWLQIEPIPKKKSTQQQDMKVPCSKLIPRLLELYPHFPTQVHWKHHFLQMNFNLKKGHLLPIYLQTQPKGLCSVSWIIQDLSCG